ncbi:zf-DHHC-domain-containing protein [Venturia nashicola]|nr:zf-DHHC-domain-containing protein [Venturia nashicola]
MARNPPSEQYQHAVNLWAARIVPAVLVGVTGYSIWVVAYLIAIKYLLDPSSKENTPRRPATATAFLVLYFVFLFPYIISYLRILQVIQTNPGYIPKGPAATKNQEKDGQGKTLLDHAAILDGSLPPPPGIETFYAKDVFVCDSFGIPIHCSTCNNWKPDRTHHCSEVGRCVRRMDHFCPWVGGIVSETTMKYFLQFTFYASLFCGFTFSITVWAIVDRRDRTGGKMDGNWIAIAACGGFFGFMALGMLLTTLGTQTKNLTNVENLGASFYMAVHLPEGSEHPLDPDGRARCGFVAYPFHHSPSRSSMRPRKFAILLVKPNENPWNLGSGRENLKTVLGRRYWEWFLPFGYPPCCFHEREDSDFPLGKGFEKLKRAHYIPETKRRKHRRRSSQGSSRS